MGASDDRASSRELADDVDVQLLGLLLQEGAGAGGAGLVHGEVHHDAVLQADELGVLPADLEDGVRDAVDQLAADEGGAGLVGGDLVVDGVGADQFPDQFPAGAGGAHAADAQPRAHLVPDVLQALVDHFHGAAVGLDVDLLDHLAGRRRAPPGWWRRSRRRRPGTRRSAFGARNTYGFTRSRSRMTRSSVRASLVGNRPCGPGPADRWRPSPWAPRRTSRRPGSRAAPMAPIQA